VSFFTRNWHADVTFVHEPNCRDHIDLWNKTKSTSNPANWVRWLCISSIQWLPGPLADYNFNDLAKSSQILFWEVK
jgi:hypothetical protein